MGSTTALLNAITAGSSNLFHMVTVIAGNGSFNGNVNGGGGVFTGGNLLDALTPGGAQ